MGKNPTNKALFVMDDFEEVTRRIRKIKNNLTCLKLIREGKIAVSVCLGSDSMADALADYPAETTEVRDIVMAVTLNAIAYQESELAKLGVFISPDTTEKGTSLEKS